ncbi:LuxR C-terminal-related transcriptional regulator [Azospirillum sp. Sh1]|uniref:LuxR C-terminal-related transcriptional regulator n=1 Tax=Azospirillum sp. Sh1 TaxID=2607285 RepID=UPI0011ECC7A5|nr:LuxR C-terminal-related transcriptional regulator [Azospirillum sp. Sh1]KAA0573454.1 hypothetical protein FZ029_20975 [Azospirillum sp. Sh1]
MNPIDVLSSRQRQLCELAAQGKSNKEIARDLDITEHTVKVHLKNAYALLGIDRRTELVGLFPPRARSGRDIIDLSDPVANAVPVDRVIDDETDRNIVALVAAGSSNQAVARGVRVSLPTAKNRVRILIRRAGVRNRTELARWWAANATKFQSMQECA